MRLDISKIKGNLNSQMDVNFDVMLEENDDIEIDFIGPVHVNAVITNTEDGYDIDGSMDVSLDAICYRCLKLFRYHEVIELHDNLNNYEEESGEKVFFNGGNQVYLDGLIRTDLLLSLPSRYLCDETCRGICPDCGADLNVGDCTCNNEPIDPRLEVLKKFLKQ
ncbi:MAG: DUF177 domain-containing protein [Thermoanaerobacteraceae bacterium]|nr:DUF177 domain-containing protein [Thermoanaerobacteraceae bacterium]